MKRLCKLLGWEALVNRGGQTWRKLDDARKAQVKDVASAIALMKENASVIKRPILDRDGQYQVGFSEENYGAFFGE